MGGLGGPFGPVRAAPPAGKLGHIMFLKSVTELGVDFDAVRGVMLCHQRSWLDGLAETAGALLA